MHVALPRLCLLLLEEQIQLAQVRCWHELVGSALAQQSHVIALLHAVAQQLLHRAIVDHGQQCELLQLLQQENASVLGLAIEFHGIFPVMN